MDLTHLKGTHRARLITLGKGWGSPQVKAQANAILGQLQTHQPTLETYGLSPEDVTELAAWVTLYPERLDDRANKQLGNKLTSRQLQALVLDAQKARRVARLRLREAEPRLLAASPDTADTPTSTADTPSDTTQALHHVQESLNQTARQPKDDPQALATQLKRLASALALAPVMAVAKPRGGAAALDALQQAEAALSQAVTEMQQRTSTASQTETLDLIDGLIVERLREINRVAKEAAKDIGSRDLAAAFQLKLLYT